MAVVPLDMLALPNRLSPASNSRLPVLLGDSMSATVIEPDGAMAVKLAGSNFRVLLLEKPASATGS
ncbi:hypothetical protein [Tardiphaga robiniae]|uniref:Uncharacterized protein n=1 Tax=Tardiphaga robiniae TaxID=943830 RepID=A0A7G6U1F1_9BRAD|nr:hypothetical protein [Tardiphaga robiniae]QND72833.1 hypothetical protein HB776_17610 [Tardiphaga robiniae]